MDAVVGPVSVFRSLWKRNLNGVPLTYDSFC